MGADLSKMKHAGVASFMALFVGAFFSFNMGYTDVISMATIGAGACPYIVGPVTGSALGASSDVMAISIAAGVSKIFI
jgi:hypothetical protein